MRETIEAQLLMYYNLDMLLKVHETILRGDQGKITKKHQKTDRKMTSKKLTLK